MNMLSCLGCSIRSSVGLFFFFKQKTAYEIGTGDWSSDVCSSDLVVIDVVKFQIPQVVCC